MSRTIIVGDVHGCLPELDSLLDKVRFCNNDRLYFVGDLVGRGPDTLGVLQLARRVGAVAVKGNHEHKLLGYHDYDGNGPPVLLGPQHIEITRQMSDEDWAWMRRMPHWCDLEEHSVRIVHAGVVPGLPIEQTPPDVLMTIRSLTSLGQPSAMRGGDMWATRYQGPPHVVFGHNALMNPQFHPDATGIDLGCVYGGFLAALVLQPHQHVPSVQSRASCLVTVPARKTYYPVRSQYRK